MTSQSFTPAAEHPDIENRPWLKFFHPDMPAEIPPVTTDSIVAVVRDCAVRFADRIAFSNMGETLTYPEVDQLSDAFAAFLQQDLQIPRGERIVIQMPNLLQYPIALFGAHKAGLIVVNANPLYTPSEMQAVIADAAPKAIVVMANFADKVEKAIAGSSIEHVIITQVGDLFSQPKKALINFAAAKIKKMVPAYNLPQAISFPDAIKRGTALKLEDVPLSQDDIAFLQYTGGTTGGTKAAVLTHGNLLANQEQFIGWMRVALGTGPATVIAALPLYHVFSLTVNCLGFFNFGAHNVLVTNPRDIPGFVKTIAKTKPQALVLVSTLAAALLDSPNFAKLNLDHLRITVAGGMAVRSSIAQRWHDRTGQDIIEGYGLTEASPVVSVNPTHLPPRVGTIGIPLPSTEVQIRTEDGQVAPVGEPGELAVRGPQLMREYWQKPSESADVLVDGWLLTGDIATMDGDGYLTIVDRKKEIILVSGFNVYPGEIEDAAMLHPGVAEAGCIGIEDEKSGEVPKLFVVKRDPAVTESEIRDFLRERLAAYKRPKFIVFRDELPKTNVGKVLRRALKDS